MHITEWEKKPVCKDFILYVPTVWHSGKGKTVEIGSVIARGGVGQERGIGSGFFMAVEILRDVNDGYVIIHLSKPVECRVNSVDFEWLWYVSVSFLKNYHFGEWFR